MSGTPNELIVYLRPQETIQPYVIEECAKWLVRAGKFTSFDLAWNYLAFIEDRNPSQFKYTISEYHRHNDYKQRSATNFRRNMNVPYSVPGAYGEDAHMYYVR